MRIAVLGYVGSGKTYISDYISEIKAIPCLHLDSIKYNKEWKSINDSVVLPQVTSFMSQESWIIDGYYERLLIDERLEKADQIIILLLPRLTCFFRTLKRTKDRKHEGYQNDINWWFVKFTLFGCRNKSRRQSYAEIATKYKAKTVVLKTRQQVSTFIKSIERTNHKEFRGGMHNENILRN